MIDGRALAVVVLVVVVLVVWSILRSPTYAEVAELILEEHVERLARHRYLSHKWDLEQLQPNLNLPAWADLEPGRRDAWLVRARRDLQAADR